MSRRFYIIDGYNLLHAAGLGRDNYGPGGLERSRNRLLRWLANRLDLDERRRTTVVFDAPSRPPDTARRQSFEQMTILFNPPGSDADAVIEDLIASHSAPKQLDVISSDHRIQRAARRRKSIPVDSDDFFAELSRVEPVFPERAAAAPAAAPTDPRDVDTPNPDETEQWLREFGVIESGETSPGARMSNPSTRPNRESGWDSHVQELLNELEEGRVSTDRGQSPR